MGLTAREAQGRPPGGARRIDNEAASVQARQGEQHHSTGGGRDQRGLWALLGAHGRRKGGRSPHRRREESHGVSTPPTLAAAAATVPTGESDDADDGRKRHSALGIPPSSKTELAEFVSILDLDDEGFAAYAPFVAICALKMHARENDSDARRAEVDEAFRLFVSGRLAAADGSGGAGGGGVITLPHLRRVAATLKLDDADDLLRDMILEANGGAGVGKGVGRDEFETVMRRAGVWR